MKKIFIVFSLLIYSAFFVAGNALATLILPGTETSLQTILNNITVGGDSSINVNSDQVSPDEIWTLTDSTIGGVNLIIELAGNAGSNTFGIYDSKDSSKMVQIFNGPADAGDKASFTIGLDGTVTVVNYSSSSTVTTYSNFFSGLDFGFYLGTINGNLFSEEDLNGDNDQMVAFQGVGDTINIGGSQREWTSGGHIIAWEDILMTNSDQDYNDMVLMVESVSPAPVPEPATMLLLGAGLVGLGAFRRKRLVKNA